MSFDFPEISLSSIASFFGGILTFIAKYLPMKKPPEKEHTKPHTTIIYNNGGNPIINIVDGNSCITIINVREQEEIKPPNKKDVS